MTGPTSPGRWTLPVLLLLAGGGAALAAAPAAAQRVQGTVVDEATLTGVPLVEVALVRSDTELTSTLTDSTGTFVLEAPGPGSYRLRASGLGYRETLSRPFQVERGRAVTVEFRISAEAVLLEPIVATVESGLGRFEFRRRREDWGRGLFLDPRTVDSISPRHPADVFRGQEDILLRWRMGTTDAGSRQLLPDIRTFQGNGCLAWVVDGRPLRHPRGGGVERPWTRFQLAGLRGDDIAAMEVYRSMWEAPPEFRNSAYVGQGFDEKQCGIVAIWTKAAW